MLFRMLFPHTPVSGILLPCSLCVPFSYAVPLSPSSPASLAPELRSPESETTIYDYIILINARLNRLWPMQQFWITITACLNNVFEYSYLDNFKKILSYCMQLGIKYK